MEKTTPVKNRIGGVFIPVRNIEKAKQWYSRILGFHQGDDYFDHLFVPKFEGTAGILLDTMPKWRNEDGDISPYHCPSVQFLTEDIHLAYTYMKENEVELVTEIEHGHFFVFKDPDGNMLMICQE